MSSKFFGNKTKDKFQQKQGSGPKFKNNTSIKSTSVGKTGRGK